MVYVRKCLELEACEEMASESRLNYNVGYKFWNRPRFPLLPSEMFQHRRGGWGVGKLEKVTETRIRGVVIRLHILNV